MTEKCKIYHNSTNFCVFVLFPFLIYSGIYSDPLSGVYITAYSLYVMENFPKYALTHNYSSAYPNSIVNSSDIFEFMLDATYW